jgi:predicted transcriptional regulator
MPVTVVSKMVAYVRSHPWALTSAIAAELHIDNTAANSILNTLMTEGKMERRQMPTYKKGKKPFGWNWLGNHDMNADAAGRAYMKRWEDAKTNMQGNAEMAADLKARIAGKRAEIAELMKQRKAAIAQREKYKQEMRKLQEVPLNAAAAA